MLRNATLLLRTVPESNRANSAGTSFAWRAGAHRAFQRRKKQIMKQFGIAGTICLLAAAAFAAETSVRYDTDRDYERERTKWFERSDDRNWCAYNAHEVEFSFFGTGTVGDDTLRNPSSKRIERDGQLGAGAGLAYFFHRNVGIEGYAYSESTGGRHFVDHVGGNLIARFPIGETGLAPYIFGGAGRQLDPVIQWTWDAGGGLQWRFLDHVAVFADARYVWCDDTKDYGLGRLGLKFGF
jgi:hypothetical protein